MAVLRCEIFFNVIFFESSDTSSISKRLTITSTTFFVVFNFLLFCNVRWFSSAREFYDVYVVVIENSHKLFFSVTILFFSASIIYALSRNPLKGLK